MMKNLLYILGTFLFLIPKNNYACTTFLLKNNGELIFGRNYDWSYGGGFINTNLKGLLKTSFKVKDGKQITWVSKYGSITFNQYGKEFATGGMNEKGLVVEVMWLNETDYAKQDNRPVLQDLQWVQYQLDNCKNIDEVLATDSFIRVSTTSAPLHFLVADANGNAATIEFLNGKMIAYSNNQLSYPVLANSSYDSSLANYKKGKLNKDNSIQRFSTACNMLKNYQQKNNNISPVDYSFKILQQVSQENYTQWSIVYDIKRKKIYFLTNHFKARKILDVTKIDFSCKAKPLSLNMNQSVKGNITSLLKPFSNLLNEKLIRAAIKATSSTLTVSDEEIERYIQFPSTVVCNIEQ